MGGFVTIGLAAREPQRLRAAAISGSGIAPRRGFAAPPVDDVARIKTPLIIFHGDQDTTVRPAQSLALQEALQASGVANERVVFEGVGHPVDQQRASDVFRLMQMWFHRHGVLSDRAADTRHR
jgi:predicted esterase